MNKFIIFGVLFFIAGVLLAQNRLPEMYVDNILVDGSTISSTNTNGDVNISPNGTGSVVITTDLDVDNLNLNGNSIISTDTNGDITIDANGTGEINLRNNVVVGTDGSTTQTLGGATVQSALDISNESANDLGGLAIQRHNDNSTFGAHILNLKSRGNFSSQAIVQDGDTLSRYVITGHDGTDYEIAAEIRGVVDGTPGSGDMPGRLEFYTTADGGTTLSEAMRIEEDGDVHIGWGGTASAILSADSTTRGFLPPRMTSTQRDNISTPSEGLLIWNTTDKTLNAHNGTAWAEIAGGGDGGGGGISNAEYNIIVSGEGNSRFESDVSGWTASGGTFVLETTDEIEGEGSASWDPSGTGQNVRSDAITVPDFLHGKSGYAEIWYQGGSGGFELYVLDGSNNELGSTEEDSTFTWEAQGTGARRVPVTFIFPESGSVKLSLETTSTASNEPEIIFDRAYIGQNFNLDLVNRIGVFSALIEDGSSTTTVSNETGNWIDGVCTNPGAGQYVCSFETGVFNDPPNCQVVSETSTGARCYLDAGTPATSSLVDIQCVNASSSAADSDFRLTCQRGDSDTRQIYTTDQSDFDWTDGGELDLDATTTTPTKATARDVDKVWYRRVGDSMEVRIEYAQTNNTGASAGSGDYLFGVPGGYQIDLTKVAEYATVEGSGNWRSFNAVGTCSANNNSATPGLGIVVVHDADDVRCLIITSATQSSINSSFADVADAGTLSYTFTYTVPIQGWKTSNRAPQLVNSVVSSTYEGVMNIQSALIEDGSSTTTVTEMTGDWIDGVCSNSGAGQYTCTINSGIFSGTPHCWCTIVGDYANTTSCAEIASSSTSFQLELVGTSGAFDSDFKLTCMGPK